MRGSDFIAENVIAESFGVPIENLRKMATGDPILVRSVRSGGTWSYSWGDLLLAHVILEFMERNPESFESETARGCEPRAVPL